ncbi:helix-turn-helix transcriptional regulator [Nonomuraea sp. NPDC026600]|uniref:helix-turn-helix domain-containing protein n=1 Tax=Nonomuraea sp. NPDC026600 TaxID=3155363 RepID=UPI00340765F1
MQQYTESTTIGARLRILRKWRKMTLAQVAGLAGMSVSHLSNIERGLSALDRRSYIAGLAGALRVSESDLVGGPHLSADPLQSEPHSHVSALRQALTSAELGESAVERARPVAELAELLAGPVEHAWRSNDYVTEGQLLPDLIDELHYHVAAPADEAALQLALNTLVEASVHASGLARILGYADLGHVGAAKAVDAANRLGDPVARGRAMYMFARSDGRDWTRAARKAEAEVARLQPDATSSEALQVLGMLMLNAAMAQAANLRLDAARAWLDEAAEVARHVPDDIDRNWESFGSTNVKIWRIKVGVEMGEGGRQVLDLAKTIDRSRLGTYPARKANFLTEVGRGLAREKKTRDGAVTWLLNAERVGPQRFRNLSRVRETVAVLMEQAKADAGGRELRGMAARLGIPY